MAQQLPDYVKLDEPEALPDYVKLDKPAPVSIEPDFDFPTGSPLAPRPEPTSLFRQGWDALTTPLIRPAKAVLDPVANWIDPPQGEGGYLRGFAAGGLQGVADLADDIFSPLGAATSATGMGAIKKGFGAGKTGVSKFLKTPITGRAKTAAANVPPVAKKPSFTRIGENEKGVVYRNNDTGEEILQPKKVEQPPARDMRFPSTEGELLPEGGVTPQFTEKRGNRNQAGTSRFGQTNPTPPPEVPSPAPYPYVKDLNALAEEGEKRLGGTVPPPPTVPPTVPPGGIPPLPPSDPHTFMRAIEDDGIILTAMNMLKGMKATGDFGPMFRQGIAYAGRPAWFKAFGQQFRSFWSEGGHQAFRDQVKANPLMQPQFQIGKLSAKNPPKSWAEMAGLDVNVVEDAMQGANLIERFPVAGRAARASNRAYNDSLASLRLNMADVIRAQYQKLHASMKKSGASQIELSNFDPDNPEIAKRIGDEINTATGRGSLKIGENKKPVRDDGGRIIGYKDRWSGEKSADILNAALFSPRLLSARLKTIKRLTWDSYLNPLTKADPIERREHLKQLLSIAGTMTTLGTAYEMFGGKSDISIQALTGGRFATPTSSDFGKSRFGQNVTIDNSGGIGRFGTLGARLGTQSTTSGRTGRNFALGSNPVVGTGKDVLIDFATGNVSPAISLAFSLVSQEEFGGKKADWFTPNLPENTLFKAAMPMIYEDLYEILKEDPSYLPLIIPAALGSGLNVYEDPKRPKPSLFEQMF